MTIDTGTKLGRYEIRSQLGAGGMGEVYLARDPKINRDVAIKVLPAAFSSDSERLRRFEQEVQATGKLNHPNILAVYDVETHDGAPYVVYELLEGETLRARLSAGALSARKAVDYALQIAGGLAAAHEKRIIHRDLKPENIFITHDGRVKILDFGLAKLTEPAHDTEPQTDVLTRRVNTDPGAVMGTVGYMSPEQVRGKSVDHRSDIFSLGVILYEMLSGKRAFRGDSAIETLNAILKEDPLELSLSNSQINSALEKVVMHCLEKRPEQRFQSARDVAFALEALSGLTSQTSEQTLAPLVPSPTRLKKREVLAWALAAMAIIAALSTAVLYFRRAPAETPATTRFFIYPPEKTTFRGSFAISPDGRRVVFRVSSEGKALLWVRALDSLTAQSLAGTEEANFPFWSPDSRFVGFVSGGKLKKIEVTGGPAQTLCEASDYGGAWNRDGVIVFSLKLALYRVSAAGGSPMPVTTLDASRKEVFQSHPRFLPDGRHFLYLASSGQQENTGIYVGSLDSKETKRLLGTDTYAAYSPPGYLLFLRERTLMAQGFDASKLELTGEPFPVAEQVDRLTGANFGLFSVSETGVLAYRSGSAAKMQLAWFDRGGKQLGTVGPPGIYSNPWLSPDEKRVAINRDDPQVSTADIWLIELARGTPTRFTFNSVNIAPIWSPDGGRIVFSTNRDGTMNLYQRAASGAGNDEALLKSDDVKLPNDWSADGSFILYQEQNPKTNYDLWVLPLSGEQKPFPFLQTEFYEAQGRFSPDGKWIAYTSNESGTWQVYVRSFPASGGKWQVSTAGGAQPQWRRDGRELFYISPDRKLMAVEAKGDGSTFEAGVPKALFEVRIPGWPGPRNYYVAAAAGQRFLVTSLLEEATATPTIVVLNWTADLKK
jgi:serine/threonine protein kinase/Tol biopolymer transport system component